MATLLELQAQIAKVQTPRQWRGPRDGFVWRTLDGVVGTEHLFSSETEAWSAKPIQPGYTPSEMFAGVASFAVVKRSDWDETWDDGYNIQKKLDPHRPNGNQWAGIVFWNDDTRRNVFWFADERTAKEAMETLGSLLVGYRAKRRVALGMPIKSRADLKGAFPEYLDGYAGLDD